MMKKGVIFILCAAFSFAVMNIMASRLTELHSMQVVFMRAFGTWIFIFPYMVFNKISIFGTHHKFLFMRSIFGMISLSTFFFAMHGMPLGSAISIRYIGPIFGAVLAMVWLKEKVTLGQWISFLIAFSGVVVIKGFDFRIQFISFLSILISAFFIGGVFVLIKYLSSREHILTIIHHFMMVSMIAGLCFVSHWRMPTVEELPYALSIGICGMIGQLFMTRAFQLEDSSFLAPFKYFELVFALIIGFLVFGERYTLIPLIGMGLIIGGMIFNIVFKNKLS